MNELELDRGILMHKKSLAIPLIQRSIRILARLYGHLNILLSEIFLIRLEMHGFLDHLALSTKVFLTEKIFLLD